MKIRRLHALVSPLAALAVATFFVACEKKTTEQPGKPPAPPSETTTEPAKSTTTNTTAKPAPAPAAAPADIASLKAAYGFAARLPKDVEAFAEIYRLHDLWEKLSNSKWSAALLALPALKEAPELQAFIEKWKGEPQAQMVKNLLEAFLGVEYVAVQPAGFADKFLPWMDVLQEFQAVNVQRGLMTGISGGHPPDSSKLLRDAAPDLIPALVKCDIPPMFFAYKAIKAKAELDQSLGQFLKMASVQPPPGVEFGTFKFADKYEFQNITVSANKLIAAFQEARLQLQLKELLGDEAKAKEAMAAILTKHAELAWGWVDDYFIISLGTDHSHLKLATSDADSALAIPVVARRAAQFLPRNPMSLSYGSATMFEKISRPMELSKGFNAITEELRGLIKPEQIETMRADVKRLEGKAKEILTTKHDPVVVVNFWDGGIRSEIFGGARQTLLNTSKPLAFAGLLSPSVVLLGDSRTNAATTEKILDFIEEGAGTLWGWYEKFGRTMVPENERQGAAMMEAIALPMVKDFWRASRQLGKALGEESAVIVDLNGTMPKLPNIPPAFAEGKVPRLAFVYELKDRAAVSEAWKGFDKIIKQLAALVPQGAGPGKGIPEPQMKKEGDVEVHFVPLPIPTDDLLPHIAITKDRWIISTSPSLSKEIGSKAAATGGAPLGSEWRVQIPALCDLGDAWFKLMPQASSPDAAPGAAKLALNLPQILRLVRSFSALELRIFEEESQTRTSVFLKLDDLK